MERPVIASAEARVPWPGPRPYDEESWQDFDGRDDEVSELIARVRREKLTVLLGASGTGKTSLIRAGVVPMLRQERYHPRGSHADWPVLLLRRWGAVSSTSLEENLLLQLEWAIDAIHAWGQHLGQTRAEADAKYLKADLNAMRQGKAKILEVIEALARAEARRNAGAGNVQGSDESRNRGGLILIFDQFEEQLRGGTPAVSEALGLISSLYHSGAPTRIILSMRREYRYALRRLELKIGGLLGRSFFLEPLKVPTVLKVVSQNSDLPIEKDVAERVIGWLTPISQGESDEVDEEQGLDLLQLQAVLVELSRFVLERGQARVNMALFDEFMSQFIVGDHENAMQLANAKQETNGYGNWFAETQSARVLGDALERWIEAALRTESRGLTDGFSAMTPEDLRLQVRRIGIRLASHLSSGDYKVAQEENALFRRALGEDIARLGINAPELRSRIRLIEGAEELPPHLNWEELGIDDNPTDTAKYSLSGLARVLDWSPAETGNQIVLCFKETLNRLAMANILRCTSFGSKGELYWELVHDQFGPNFMNWAERQRYTWDDCKNSLVACAGHPIAVPVTEIRPPVWSEYYDVNKISWQGCSIQNNRLERLTLRSVRFLDCFLPGTIFDSIDFIGCSFEHCILEGGLFRNCSFFPNEKGQPTKFVRCDSNVVIVGGTIDSLEFQDCHLRQPAISNTRLEGEIRYRSSSRVLQAFFDVRNGGGPRDGAIIFDESSRAFQCTATPESFGYLKFATEDSGMHNTQLQDDFWLRE